MLSRLLSTAPNQTQNWKMARHLPMTQPHPLSVFRNVAELHGHVMNAAEKRSSVMASSPALTAPCTATVGNLIYLDSSSMAPTPWRFTLPPSCCSS